MGKLLWSAIVMVLLVTGCGWNGTPTREDDISPVTSIAISADYSTIAKGTSVKLKATGHISGLGTRDLTDKVTWTSSDTTKADFKSLVFKNRVTGVDVGSSPISITATYTATNGTLLSVPYALTVSAAKIQSIAVTANKLTVPNGLTQQFIATGTFDDGTTQDISLDVAWKSSDTSVASISTDEISNGLATANASTGTSTITATFNSGDGYVPGSAVMTATDPVVISIAVTPANPSVLSLSTKQFKATGTYSDNSTADITSNSKVAWSSSNTAYATIKSSGGVATTLAQGSTTITATLDNNSGSTALTVTGGNLDSISITPSVPTLVKDTKTRITVLGTFSNGSTRDITGAVTWASSNDTYAAVAQSGGNLAWLNAKVVSSGTTITATGVSAATKTKTATVIVTDPTVTSLVISSPTSISPLALTAGVSSQLTATAYSSNPASTDVTFSDGCSWSPGTTSSVATVGTAGLAKGRVTAVDAGTAEITATYGSFTKTFSVNVTSRTLKSLAITGLPSVSAGNQTSYTATATYEDGTSQDVTYDTTWSITPENVAVLADSTNQPGQIVAVSNGIATLTASFGGTSGKTATKTIMVP